MALMRMLLARLSEDGLRNVISSYGGMRLYLPATPSTELIGELGEELAAKLCRHFGGEISAIPTHMPAPSAAMVAELRRQGMGINEIARTVGRSSRRVAELLSSIADLPSSGSASLPSYDNGRNMAFDFRRAKS